jgi:aspartyl-tRNA(Asn)/glutamyl-tRNA(Gln) amidotransferase subunit A
VTLGFESIATLRQSFQSGRQTPSASLAALLDRIDARDPALNAFAQVDAAGAISAAAESGRRYASGTQRPLEGVPLAIKENLAVAGLDWTGGVVARQGRIAHADAASVARLRTAGAIILGTVRSHEAALGATTDHPLRGATYNPHKASFTPGGSSGGSGAAVAAGLCTAALGTDTLGSIRLPASYCGVYGLKPTPGLVPADGLLALEPSLDVIGPMARSLDDLHALWAVLAPESRMAPAIRQVATLAVVDDADQDRAVERTTRLARDLLAGLGVEVSQAVTPGLDLHASLLAGLRLCQASAGALFADDLARDSAGFSPLVAGFLLAARQLTPDMLAMAHAQVALARRAVLAVLAGVDALLLPVSPRLPFPQGTPPPVDQADFTALANLAGLPALVLPAGMTADGLPIGIQLMGRPGTEQALLDLAARLDHVMRGYQPPLAFT